MEWRRPWPPWWTTWGDRESVFLLVLPDLPMAFSIIDAWWSLSGPSVQLGVGWSRVIMVPLHLIPEDSAGGLLIGILSWDMKYGVPHGLMLSPKLFNIYLKPHEDTSHQYSVQNCMFCKFRRQKINGKYKCHWEPGLDGWIKGWSTCERNNFRFLAEMRWWFSILYGK